MSEEDELLAIIEEMDRTKPEAWYRAKMVSVRHCQAKGIPDRDIEVAFGITLKPEDRRQVKPMP